MDPISFERKEVLDSLKNGDVISYKDSVGLVVLMKTPGGNFVRLNRNPGIGKTTQNIINEQCEFRVLGQFENLFDLEELDDA